MFYTYTQSFYFNFTAQTMYSHRQLVFPLRLFGDGVLLVVWLGMSFDRLLAGCICRRLVLVLNKWAQIKSIYFIQLCVC